MSSAETRSEKPSARPEALLLLAYFAVYFGYLFLRLENETMHWLSLVLLPLLIIRLRQLRVLGVGWRHTLASVGLKWGNLTTGLLLATVIGLLVALSQLWLSERLDHVLEVLAESSLLLLLVVFVLMLLTAGFTEEFFFRGCLQTRLARLTRHRWLGVALTAVLFGLYHLPYAYLHPRWPSHGDWGAAWNAAMFQGVVGGLILGAIYERAKRNLLAPVVAHALINTLPAVTLIRFSVG